VSDVVNQQGQGLDHADRYNTLLYFRLEAVMLQSSNMASTMVNHTSGLSKLKSSRRVLLDDTALAAAFTAAFMAAISNAGAPGWRPVPFLPYPLSVITKNH
jgi:hypothetical protein